VSKREPSRLWESHVRERHFIATMPAAHADDQGFFDYIHSRGVPATYGVLGGVDPPDHSNRKAGEAICDVLHRGGGPGGVPFLGMQQKPVPRRTH